MSAKTPCPDGRRLEGLLDDRLPEGEQSSLTEHVGACSACQQVLEELASGPEPARLRAAHNSQPTSGSAYWSAVERLEQEVTQEVPASESPAPGTDPLARRASEGQQNLDFLAPSDDPAYLGWMDHFGIVGVLGRGGMGLVLRGHDTYLERAVAVKVLDPAMAEDDVARQRFCREARAAASITHENVVAVHHVAHEESSEMPYLVMQLVEGEALDERLAREGPLEIKEIVRIGREIAAGLAAAHANGLIHRDVKPANVLLERGSGRVKLTDFGLARIAEDVRLTRSGMVTGTPLYMAPEQARGEEVDHRSDLFSLGVLLYELCTGRTPFEAATPLAVMRKLTDEPHAPLRDLRPDAPAWLVEVIDHLLAKAPADRFQSAQEVADLLDHYWSALRTSSEVVPVCPQRRRRRLQLMALLLAAVAAGALLTTLALRFWKRPSPGVSPDASPAPLAVLPGSSGTVWGVSFSPDDHTLAMGIEDGTVKLWDLETRSVRASLSGHRASVWWTASNPAGTHLLTASDDNTVRIWDLTRNTTVKTLTSTGAVRVALFAPDGDTIYTGDRDSNVRVWSQATGQELRAWKHSASVFALALSPDGNTVATAGTDRVIRLWDARTGQERLPLNGHTGSVYSLAFRPDGKVLASAGWDKVVRLWDAGSGNLLHSLNGHAGDVWSVAFAPDGKTLASAGQDGTVRVWDAASGRPLAVLRGHESTVHSVTFSRDGSRIASGGRDGTVRLWAAVRPEP